jgi:hypothetical protein
MRRKFDKHIPPDRSIVSLAKDSLPQVPENFDLQLIKSQLRHIGSNSSLFSKYMTALKTRFTLRTQISVLNKLEDYNQAVISGVASEIEIKNKHRELLEAERSLLIAKADLDDVGDDLEIKKLEREAKKHALQRQIAEEQKAIRELEDHSKTDARLDRLEKALLGKMEEKRLRHSYDIQEALLQFEKEFETKIALKQALQKMQKRIEENKDLSEEDKKELLENMSDYISRF